MKCPLTYKHEVSLYQGRTYGIQTCLKEECAWWNESVEKCCVPVLTANAIVLNLFIQEIVNKMPKGEQFGK